jgi:hypothetical protein
MITAFFAFVLVTTFIAVAVSAVGSVFSIRSFA